MTEETSEDCCLYSRVVYSPALLMEAIKSLTHSQKEAVSSMGFDSLLQLRITDIPKTLAFHVVKHLDTDAMIIRTRNGEIPVDREAVRKVYGFPMGDISIVHSRSNNYKNHPTVKLWKEHLDLPGAVIPEVLLQNIKESGSDTFTFRLDFLVLLVSTLICSMKNGSVYQRFLPSISSNSIIKDFDWCGLVVDAVKECKKGWTPHNRSCFFVGPLTFLVLLYCDRVRIAPTIERVRPVIIGWTSENLMKREESELEGGFVLGELLPDDNERTEEELVVESVAKALDDVKKLIDNATSRFGENEWLQSVKNKWNATFSDQDPDVGTMGSCYEHSEVGDEGTSRGREKRKKPQPSNQPAQKRRTRASLVAQQEDINEDPDSSQTNERDPDVGTFFTEWRATTPDVDVGESSNTNETATEEINKGVERLRKNIAKILTRYVNQRDTKDAEEGGILRRSPRLRKKNKRVHWAEDLCTVFLFEKEDAGAP
ncbi:hypothetical protein QVD17_17744 [Tagetes erecta]|uniref:Aminotransferase-like plant mobile domain-containing protein n=1 Tax=Tagetes erecta TaxID=13708 RepID=A0AAD8KUH7_TARER|nr:hypothetical protein QVD17_17744 [Tagetes erecta]